MISKEEKTKACKEYFAEAKMKLKYKKLMGELMRLENSVYSRILIWKEIYGMSAKEIYEKLNLSRRQYYRELSNAYVVFYETYLT